MPRTRVISRRSLTVRADGRRVARLELLVMDRTTLEEMLSRARFSEDDDDAIIGEKIGQGEVEEIEGDGDASDED